MIIQYSRRLGIMLVVAVMLTATMSARAAEPTALDLAVVRIQDQTGGRILKAGPVRDENGQFFFRIKVLLPDGRIKVFWVSADR
jgi:hypothetical protein